MATPAAAADLERREWRAEDYKEAGEEEVAKAKAAAAAAADLTLASAEAQARLEELDALTA